MRETEGTTHLPAQISRPYCLCVQEGENFLVQEQVPVLGIGIPESLCQICSVYEPPQSPHLRI